MVKEEFNLSKEIWNIGIHNDNNIDTKTYIELDKLKKILKESVKILRDKMKYLGYYEDVEMARAIINEHVGDELKYIN